MIPIANASSTTGILDAIDKTIPFGISNILGASLGIAGLLAFGMIIFAGFKIILSNGNSAQQSDGRDMIKSAILGLILLASGYILLNIINPRILNQKDFNLGKVTALDLTDIEVQEMNQILKGVISNSMSGDLGNMNRVVSGNEITNEVPLYLQGGGEAWANTKYGSGAQCNTYAYSGCGPTSIAMITSYLMKEKILPPDIGSDLDSNGYRDCLAGTKNGAMDYIANKYKFSLSGPFSSEKDIDSCFESEGVLVANTNLNSLSGSRPSRSDLGDKPWLGSANGHFIVLTGMNVDHYYVNDPAGGNKTPTKAWLVDYLSGGAWCFKK